MLRFLAGAVGEPDNRERRDAALQVSLDLDAAWIEADERMRDRVCEHVVTVGDRPATPCTKSATLSPQARRRRAAGAQAQPLRAIRTSSKYSPARRPVRRLT
jgi:hypothetical protein